MTAHAGPNYRTRIAAFQADDHGAVAMIFALVCMILVMFVGLAIDMGRVVHARAKIESAIDAAALAGAKGLRLQNLSDAETTALAKTMFDNNLKGSGGDYAVINSVNVRIDRPNSSVSIQVDADVPATFAKVAGIEKFSVPRQGEAVFVAKDFEIGLQLDVTGSMGGSKISDLRAATKDLIDILIPDNPTGQKVRIGLAPFSAGINAGGLAPVVTGTTASNSCVYERRTAAYQTSDAGPYGSARLTAYNELPGAQPCPSSRVLPMTDDKRRLKSAADGLSASGTTAGHLGTAWAWYLVSPEWNGVFTGNSEPTAYGGEKVIKVAILMTDGEYNTVGGAMTTANIARSSDTAKATCSAMKAKGLIVYTVGFRLTESTAKDVMGNCASGSGKAFLADDGVALREAFRAIAYDIASLKLTR